MVMGRVIHPTIYRPIDHPLRIEYPLGHFRHFEHSHLNPGSSGAIACPQASQ